MAVGLLLFAADYYRFMGGAVHRGAAYGVVFAPCRWCTLGAGVSCRSNASREKLGARLCPRWTTALSPTVALIPAAVPPSAVLAAVVCAAVARCQQAGRARPSPLR